MGELIITTELEHRKGYLYYVKRSKEGKIEVYEAKMARNGRTKKKKDAKD